MGFLGRKSVPDELPDLAIEGSSEKGKNEVGGLASPLINASSQDQSVNGGGQVPGEHYLEFNNPEGENIEAKKEISKRFPDLEIPEGESSGFFNKILEDINDEIQDLGKLEDWYQNKFLPQDVVSNMRSYWEDNKADMIIKSFGSEYKRKINEKIKQLQILEEDWRSIYFKLIKKEEEMKKGERALKETLSEFVDLCRRRGDLENDKNDKKAKNKEES